jgi:hypothetical protein
MGIITMFVLARTHAAATATAQGGPCDGQTFRVPARRPPASLHLTDAQGTPHHYHRSGPAHRGPIAYRSRR